MEFWNKRRQERRKTNGRGDKNARNISLLFYEFLFCITDFINIVEKVVVEATSWVGASDESWRCRYPYMMHDA
jgi:hypothetical protein